MSGQEQKGCVLYVANFSEITIRESTLLQLPDAYQTRIRSACKKSKVMEQYAAALLLDWILKRDGFSLRDLQRTSENKPYVSGFRPFNISHSGTYVAVGIGEDEIGIDLQEKKKIPPKAAQLFWGEESADPRLSSIPFPYAYLWCRKEAFLKCLGSGWGEKKEQTYDALADHIVYRGESYYLTDVNWIDGYYLTVCQKKNVHICTVIEVPENEWKRTQ